MNVRAYYSAYISDFLCQQSSTIVGDLSKHHSQDLVHQQTNAWLSQIQSLKQTLSSFSSERNSIFFEFGIPRMGKRADVVLVISGLVFVLEYKVGATRYERHDKNQTLDYALDLKHFHEGSHDACIVPILVATNAEAIRLDEQDFNVCQDGLADLLCANKENLAELLTCCVNTWATPVNDGGYQLLGDGFVWATTAYKPTPTIVQAAQALYQGHKVEDISRNDAGTKNLSETADTINKVIERAKARNEKAICFVTGVPGAGKTLAGLNITTNRMRSADDEHAVFLSGNGPLVDVLREALAKDETGRSEIRIGEARRNAKTFIQNIHHFRDDNLNTSAAPVEKVVVFDEAQRAWDKHHTTKFMQQKRNQPDFDQSEPEFLLEVMDRHDDWCVVVALIGGGQEINTGEAGLPEWFSALRHRFMHWRVCYSDEISGIEYTQGVALNEHIDGLMAEANSSLHLSVAVRSFRAEKLSEFIAAIIENDITKATKIYSEISADYPIVLTRDLSKARLWLKQKTRGGELCGLIASSGAIRLKPEGLNVKAAISPEQWFLNGDQDVRSCQYLEDVATEFDVQGLELDWTAVCWDADFRYEYDEVGKGAWSYNAFKGTKWQKISKLDRQRYLANAYRVLLTRARQGMVIYVPKGSDNDTTRPPSYYEGVAELLMSCGLMSI
jgi:hypothetical protein